jgi:hypothetical protein
VTCGPWHELRGTLTSAFVNVTFIHPRIPSDNCCRYNFEEPAPRVAAVISDHAAAYEAAH